MMTLSTTEVDQHHQEASEASEASEMLLTQPERVVRPSVTAAPTTTTAPSSSANKSISTNKQAIQVLLERGVLEPGKSKLELQLRNQTVSCTVLQSGSLLGVYGKVHNGGLCSWANPLLVAEGLPKLKGQQVANVDVRVSNNGCTLASLLGMTFENAIIATHQHGEGAQTVLVPTNQTAPAQMPTPAIWGASTGGGLPTLGGERPTMPWQHKFLDADEEWAQIPPGGNIAGWIAQKTNGTMII
jgi:hypothetical protein